MSVSYSDNEGEVNGGKHLLAYLRRVNVEFQKAGVRGVSVLTATGDYGVAGSWDEYVDQEAQKKVPCPHFNAVFPAVSAWVTSVGSTTTLEPDHSNMHHREHRLRHSKTTGEIAARFSGGGFSRIFQQPAYQQKAVRRYFSSKYVQSRLPPQHLYAVPAGGVLIGPGSSTNIIGGGVHVHGGARVTGAAFPDVAALGEAFAIYKHGKVAEVTGTSGSSEYRGCSLCYYFCALSRTTCVPHCG
jgi:tripeptidyl-peptidase-1